MKKVATILSVALLGISLAACGVAQEDYDAAQASAASLEQDRNALQTQLTETEAKLATAETELQEFRSAEEKRQQEKDAEEKRKAEEKKKKEEAEKKEKDALKKAKKVTKRELAQVVKKPDSNVGRNLIIYARVTQFDSATGPCTFRANVSHAHVGKYDYEHNSIFNAGDGLLNCDVLDDVVQDDIIQVTAEVSGSLSYDTQIGGSTTVPEFQVVKLKQL